MSKYKSDVDHLEYRVDLIKQQYTPPISLAVKEKEKEKEDESDSHIHKTDSFNLRRLSMVL